MITKSLFTISKLSAIALVLTLSCTKAPVEELPGDPVLLPLTATEIKIVDSGNDFAFDVFNKVVDIETASKNIMISPLSISYALSMTLNGANGTTREAMFEALRLNDITIPELNTGYKTLTPALTTVDKRVTVKIANSVWIENDFVVKKSFTDVLSENYNTVQEKFEVTDPAAPDKINKWIEDNTNGLIKEMVEELNDNTVMLLINAIYFKGKWRNEFDVTDTKNEPFYKTDGTNVTAKMMKQTGDLNYYQGNGFAVAELPYGQGNYVIDIILPDEGNKTSSISSALSGEGYDIWTEGLSGREVNITIPRFKYGYKKTLKEILTDMGMGIAFTDGADFTNIALSPPLLINDVTHQTFIETNEEGTEAAAATIVDVGNTSVGPMPIDFVVDHTFYYIIREITTNTIIFMGRVSDPLVN